jgi:hypothetical protein
LVTRNNPLSRSKKKPVALVNCCAPNNVETRVTESKSDSIAIHLLPIFFSQSFRHSVALYLAVCCLSQIPGALGPKGGLATFSAMASTSHRRENFNLVRFAG